MPVTIPATPWTVSPLAANGTAEGFWQWTIVSESGLPGFQSGVDYVVFATGRTPPRGLSDRMSDAEWIKACTYSDPERFYSYRRTTHAKEADYGRLISVIRL